jgi:L-ascorbate metabolism protein UlaG (beta-lactamase superfamily)
MNGKLQISVRWGEKKSLFSTVAATMLSLLLGACGTTGGTSSTSTPAPTAAGSAANPAASMAGKVTVRWLGQSATKITTPGGKVIVIDPWLTTNPKTPEPFKRLEALGKVDLILIPIGGHFVMDPKDAAVSTREMIKPKYAIPIHYGTTPLLKGTPEEYISALGNTLTRVVPMKPGEAIQF